MTFQFFDFSKRTYHAPYPQIVQPFLDVAFDDRIHIGRHLSRLKLSCGFGDDVIESPGRHVGLDLFIPKLMSNSTNHARNFAKSSGESCKTSLSSRSSALITKPPVACMSRP